jgi:hypothetical protein
MDTRVKCKGGCGREKTRDDLVAGGFGMYRGDKMIEWVCDSCWKKGVRTTACEEQEKNRA